MYKQHKSPSRQNLIKLEGVLNSALSRSVSGFFTEKDFLLRMGAFHPTFDKKIVLLNYILFKFLYD